MEFYKFELDIVENVFNDLLRGVDFEPVTKGRIGNHLVKSDQQGVPIVRTTTRYNIPAHNFSEAHHELIENINQSVSIPALDFNNALLEVYDANYYKMNFHSDQALDLADDSYIGVFTCYEHPEILTEAHIRKLKIKDKGSEEEFEIPLTHHSVVLFSTSINKKYQHKIVLDAKPAVADNRWLGMTLRRSKTYIQFENNIPYFSDGKRLELADKEQETEFFKLRGEENRGLDFVYPELTYTVNIADTMLPK